jgi:N-methylhydantoinase A
LSIVGIDIGGTFTDLAGFEDGGIVTSKCLTVPADPTSGAAQALRIAGCDPSTLTELLHGSTIAINTVLEKSGAKSALITTRGFRDVYAIGRGNRPDAFNLFFHRPRPLVPRELTFELSERINAAGEILVPIESGAVEAVGRKLTTLGIEAVAVCFLHSYANPAHEIAAGNVLRAHFPHLFVTLSCEILREFREYERTSTTVLNAYIGPRVARYLAGFESFAKEQYFAGNISIMRSNGGTMSIARARREPVAMMESGPVAGMIGAGALANLLGIPQAIGFDMGGTTAKCTLLTAGVAPIAEGYVIGDRFTGQPMQLPVVEIVEVGAGGGSLAWCDAAGGLHVGPVSAGADPGPACYGRGGQAPTVSDADLVLGRLNGERFLGGSMRLDGAAAQAALERIGRALSLAPAAAALGISTIVDGAMSLAVRGVSLDRGIDPRDTTLIAFGGAGPLHVIAIAREISIPRVVVPRLPGNFSALGMLMAQWRHDFVRTLIGTLGRLRPSDAGRALAELRSAGEEALGAEHLARGRFDFAADLRYRGQEHAIAIAVAGAEELTTDVEPARSRFHQQHEARHGHAAPEEEIEVVNLRLVVTVPRAEDAIAGWLARPWAVTEMVPEGRRTVVFDDAKHPLEARILWRPSLTAGTELVGPAIIEEPNSTTLIGPRDHALINESGHIVVTLDERMKS